MTKNQIMWLTCAYDMSAVVYLDSGLVKLNVVESLLVSAQLALQFVHTDRFLSERVQLVTVGPSRPSIRQQLVALQESTAKKKKEHE